MTIYFLDKKGQIQVEENEKNLCLLLSAEKEEEQ